MSDTVGNNTDAGAESEAESTDEVSKLKQEIGEIRKLSVGTAPIRNSPSFLISP